MARERRPIVPSTPTDIRRSLGLNTTSTTHITTQAPPRRQLGDLTRARFFLREANARWGMAAERWAPQLLQRAPVNTTPGSAAS